MRLIWYGGLLDTPRDQHEGIESRFNLHERTARKTFRGPTDRARQVASLLVGHREGCHSQAVIFLDAVWSFETRGESNKHPTKDMIPI